MNHNTANGRFQDLNSPERIKERMEWSANVDWARTDPQVQRDYWEQYVAVHQKRVVAHGTEMAKVLEEAQRVTGLPRDKIAIVAVVGIGAW